MLFSGNMCLSNIRRQIPQRIKHRHIYTHRISTYIKVKTPYIIHSNVLGPDCWNAIPRASSTHVSVNQGFAVYRYSVSWMWHVLVQWPMLPPRDELGLLEGRLGNLSVFGISGTGWVRELGRSRRLAVSDMAAADKLETVKGETSRRLRGERGEGECQVEWGSFCARWPELPFWL